MPTDGKEHHGTQYICLTQVRTISFPPARQNAAFATMTIPDSMIKLRGSYGARPMLTKLV